MDLAPGIGNCGQRPPGRLPARQQSVQGRDLPAHLAPGKGLPKIGRDIQAFLAGQVDRQSEDAADVVKQLAAGEEVAEGGVHPVAHHPAWPPGQHQPHPRPTDDLAQLVGGHNCVPNPLLLEDVERLGDAHHWVVVIQAGAEDAAPQGARQTGVQVQFPHPLGNPRHQVLGIGNKFLRGQLGRQGRVPLVQASGQDLGEHPLVLAVGGLHRDLLDQPAPVVHVHVASQVAEDGPLTRPNGGRQAGQGLRLNAEGQLGGVLHQSCESGRVLGGVRQPLEHVVRGPRDDLAHRLGRVHRDEAVEAAQNGHLRRQLPDLGPGRCQHPPLQEQVAQVV